MRPFRRWSLDKPLKKPTKRLQFFQMARAGQSTKCPGPQSSRPTSGKGVSASLSSGPKTSLPWADVGRGKSFRRFLASHSASGRRYSRAALEFLALLHDRGLDGGSPLLQMSHSLPPPLTCVTRTSWVLFLWLGVCKGSSTSRRSR